MGRLPVRTGLTVQFTATTSFRIKRGRCYLDGDTLRLASRLRGQWHRYREGGWLPASLMMPSLRLSYGDGGFQRAKGTFRNAGIEVEA